MRSASGARGGGVMGAGPVGPLGVGRQEHGESGGRGARGRRGNRPPGSGGRSTGVWGRGAGGGAQAAAAELPLLGRAQELLNAHKDNLGNTIKFVVFNEPSARNPNNMQILYTGAAAQPELALWPRGPCLRAWLEERVWEVRGAGAL